MPKVKVKKKVSFFWEFQCLIKSECEVLYFVMWKNAEYVLKSNKMFMKINFCSTEFFLSRKVENFNVNEHQKTRRKSKLKTRISNDSGRRKSRNWINTKFSTKKLNTKSRHMPLTWNVKLERFEDDENTEKLVRFGAASSSSSTRTREIKFTSSPFTPWTYENWKPFMHRISPFNCRYRSRRQTANSPLSGRH